MYFGYKNLFSTIKFVYFILWILNDGSHSKKAKKKEFVRTVFLIFFWLFSNKSLGIDFR
jgi:hypothetical protein